MIAIFVILTLIMLVSGHAFLWWSFVRFFAISKITIKIFLAVLLGLMSLSFIVSTFIVHWSENWLADKFYLVSGVWLGLIWYVAIAVAATWIFYWVGQWTDIEMPLRTISIIFMTMAIAYTIYGMVNAFTPIVRSEEVLLKNLPAAWQSKKIVHLSDIHLGTVHKKPFMQNIVDEVNGLKPDIVFITGDIFDGAGQTLNHMLQPINNINAPLGIYAIIGNHETYLSLDKSLAAIKDTKIKLLRDEVAEVNGIQIAGIDYPMPGEEHDIEDILNKLDKNKATIVLYHEPKEDVWEKIKEAGGDLMLSGHTHKGQLWPFGRITKMMYGPYHQGLHKIDDFYINTSSGIGTWGPPMKTTGHSEIIEITLK